MASHTRKGSLGSSRNSLYPHWIQRRAPRAWPCESKFDAPQAPTARQARNGDRRASVLSSRRTTESGAPWPGPVRLGYPPEVDARVELEALRKTFVQTKRRGLRRERTEIVAVDGVSLSIPAGQSVAFIGPNGAGKSTTIKMLTGILLPTSGTARVLGLTPWHERPTLARHIGAVFGQRSQLWYHLPPRDTFEVLARVYDLDRATYVKARDTLIERFGLGPFHAGLRRYESGNLLAMRE
jgi:ABC-type glutathione transport system ATPase component